MAGVRRMGGNVNTDTEPCSRDQIAAFVSTYGWSMDPQDADLFRRALAGDRLAIRDASEIIRDTAAAVADGLEGDRMKRATAEIVVWGRMGFPVGARLLDGPHAGVTFVLDAPAMARRIGEVVTVEYHPDDQFAYLP